MGGGKDIPESTPPAYVSDAAADPAAAAPATAPAGSPLLKFHLEAEYESYAQKHPTDETVAAVCHIVAPAEAEAAATKAGVAAGEADVRAPLDLVAVIDVSGSMEGDKLKLVQETLEFVVANLKADDRLGLVAFDSNVSTPLALMAMDAKGKADALEACHRLRAGSCTNLSGGLFAGIDMLKKRAARVVPFGAAPVSSLLLLTDGMANEGVRGNDLTAAARNLMADAASAAGPFSLYTFGYGSSHEATLLKSLAEVGNGMYYFIESNEAVPSSFGDCLGGLLTTCAQNLELTLHAAPGTCTITHVDTTRTVKLAPDGSSATVTLGDMQAEEARDVVLQLRLTALDAPAPSSTAHITATLTYVSVLTASLGSQTAELSLARPAEVPPAGSRPASELVREQLRRVEAAAAIHDAMQAAESGNLEAARGRINHWKQKHAAATGASAAGLVCDMDEALTSLSTKAAYQQHGAYCMSSAVQMHSAQRSNRVFASEEAAEGRTSYVTSKKAAFRGMFSKKA